MSLNYNDLFNSVILDGHNIIDNFKNKNIEIESAYEILEKIKVDNNIRLDQMSLQKYDDDFLFWLILSLNQENIKNPLSLNFNYVEHYKSLIKTLVYNPVEYMKSTILNEINNYIIVIKKVINQLVSGNITPSVAYYSSLYYSNFDLLIEISDIVIRLQSKNEIEYDEESNPIDQFKQITNDYLNDFNFDNLLLNFIPNNLNIYDSSKYTIIDETLIDFDFDSNILLRIKYMLKYLYFWSTNK